MASLDFAFLSESARLDAGNSLSALGIAFTHLQVPELPHAHTLNVAGLVWMTEEDGGEADITITLLGAEDAYEVVLDNTIATPPDEPVLEGKQAASFIVTVTLPLVTTGIHRVNIDLNGTFVRSLAFEVVPPSEAGNGRFGGNDL